MQPDRHFPLAGASNFRDFGGYPTEEGRTVKWRRLFRSDRLSELTEADRARLAPLGVRCVWDLRRGSEAAAAPTTWPDGRVIRAPVFEDEAGPSTLQRLAAAEGLGRSATVSRAIMAQMYLRMVTDPGPLAVFRRLFEHLAQDEAGPVLLHCSGGKDRTGVAAALILLGLGVSREDVTADFMLTQRYYEADAAMNQRVAQIVAEAGLDGWSPEALAPIFDIQQAYIDTALGVVADAGGIEPFLEGRVGVGAATLERVRAVLLA